MEDEDCDPDGVTTIDQFLAETIDGRDPIKALIGYSPDLGSALLGLLATLAAGWMTAFPSPRSSWISATRWPAGACLRWRLPCCAASAPGWTDTTR